MIEERIRYCDRMIARLRKEQDEILIEWDELEEIIKSYEIEADRLEGEGNDKG